MKFFKNSWHGIGKTTKTTQQNPTKTSPQVLKQGLGVRLGPVFLKKLFSNTQKSTNPNTTKKTTKQKWAIFLIFSLIIIPTALPTQASIFDPLLKILLPFYSADDDKTDLENSPAVAPQPQPVPDSRPVATDPLPLYDSIQAPTDTASTQALLLDEPDLFILLQAEFAADRGDAAQALQLYKAESFKRNATAVFERALELSLQHEPILESLTFAELWSEQNPEHVPAWFYVAHLALRAEDYHTAAKMLNRILALDADADLTQILTGIFPTSYDAQRALFSALQTTDSDNNASLSVLKAGLLMQFNEPIPARLHADNALRFSPDNLAILTLKADILYNSGEHAALTKFLAEARATTTGDTQKELYLYEIRRLIDHQDLQGAWKLLEVSSQTFSDDHELVLLASLVALDIAEYAAANDRLNKLVDDPLFASEAHYYLGISHERTAQHGMALSHYRQVTSPDLIWDATQKIIAYQLLLGESEQAISALEQLRATYPDYTADSYILQADILIRQGKPDTATTLLTQAVNDSPEDAQLLYTLITLLADDEPNKTELIGKLIALDADNPSHQLVQARHQLTKDPNDPQALNIAHSLSQMSRQDYNYNSDVQRQALELLAQNALANSNYAMVLEYLQMPYELKPELNTGILLLRAYQGLGDTQMVNALLADLKTRFGNANSPVDETSLPQDGDDDTSEILETVDDTTLIAPTS